MFTHQKKTHSQLITDLKAVEASGQGLFRQQVRIGKALRNHRMLLHLSFVALVILTLPAFPWSTSSWALILPIMGILYLVYSQLVTQLCPLIKTQERVLKNQRDEAFDTLVEAGVITKGRDSETWVSLPIQPISLTQYFLIFLMFALSLLLGWFTFINSGSLYPGSTPILSLTQMTLQAGVILMALPLGQRTLLLNALDNAFHETLTIWSERMVQVHEHYQYDFALSPTEAKQGKRRQKQLKQQFWLLYAGVICVAFLSAYMGSMALANIGRSGFTYLLGIRIHPIYHLMFGLLLLAAEYLLSKSRAQKKLQQYSENQFEHGWSHEERRKLQGYRIRSLVALRREKRTRQLMFIPALLILAADFGFNVHYFHSLQSQPLALAILAASLAPMIVMITGIILGNLSYERELNHLFCNLDISAPLVSPQHVHGV